MEKSTSWEKHEKERLKRLRSYRIGLEYTQEGTFQDVVSMAAHIFHVPLAFVSIVDAEETILTSGFGMSASRAPRVITPCSIAIEQHDVTVFNDTRLENRLACSPLVQGEFGLHFYAAAPLTTPDGYNIGMLGIGDYKPRHFSEDETVLLKGLAELVMGDIESRKSFSEVTFA